ncbi:MAG: putative membrane protein YkoI [Arenicella sp.]|jgi:uncharacterized membrane protein YkoI
MPKHIAYRLLLTIALHFVVVNGAYAFDYGSALEQSSGASYSLNVSQFSDLEYSQNDSANLRSRSEVVQEVKRRYNAEVLKISLDKSQQVYRVRVLMPGGKVRNLQVSARR